MPATVLDAAERIRETLEVAKRDGYYGDAWYFYVRKADVEKMVNHVLGDA